MPDHAAAGVLVEEVSLECSGNVIWISAACELNLLSFAALTNQNDPHSQILQSTIVTESDNWMNMYVWLQTCEENLTLYVQHRQL